MFLTAGGRKPPPVGRMEEAAAAALAAGGTWEKDPAAAAPHQSWALLDPTIIEEDPAADATAFAVCTASDGQEVRVSLRLAEPPSSSYVQLRTDAEVYVKPSLLAADGDLIIIHMVVAVARDPPFTSFEDNLFVYKSRPGPAMGRLRLLPQLPDSAAPVRHTGIACRGQDFVVASFHTRVIGDDEEMGILSRFSSSTGEWDVLDLPIPFDPKKGLYKFVWGTDDKFAFEGLMFWVDYHRGMIYCDVFADSPELHFIQLPGIDIWDQNHDYSQGRQLPEAYRTVSVSRGELKFVDIDDGLFGTKKTSGFKITTWSLKLTDFKWVKDAIIQVDDIWSLPNFQDSPLPRWVPEYPVVSKKDSSIIHFILRGPQSDAKAWIITLDTRNEVLKSYKLFTNEQNLVFEDCDVDTRNIFLDTPFISCDFDHPSKSTGHCLDTVEKNWEANLLSGSGSKKRKLSSCAVDIIEVPYTSDSDSDSDSDDSSSDECDSDSSGETCEHRAMQSLSTSFYEILKKSTMEELNEPTRNWHCPACSNAPGGVVWYKGLKSLLLHAQTERSSRVNHHRKLAALLENPHGASLVVSDNPCDKGKGLPESSLRRLVAKPWSEAEYQKFRKLSSVLASNCLSSFQRSGQTFSRGQQTKKARDLNIPQNKRFDVLAGI